MDAEEYFDSLLLEENDVIQLTAETRNIFTPDDEGLVEITVIDAVLAALTSVAAKTAIGEKAKNFVENHFGDAGFKFNAGLRNRLTLSGEGINLDGSLATREGQTVKGQTLETCRLNPTEKTYSFTTSYAENLTMGLDLLASFDVFFKFSILGGKITLWNYKRELLEQEIPLLSEDVLENLDLEFTSAPESLTFPLREPIRLAQDSSQADFPEGVKARFGKGNTSTITYSPDGCLLAVVGTMGIIRLYHVKTGDEWELFTWTGPIREVTSLSFSPDGKTIAIGDVYGRVILWDLEAGTQIATLTGPMSWVTSLSFSPDGKTIASADSEEVRLWDVKTRTEIAILTGHTRTVESVSFSPDGKTLASADSEESAIVGCQNGNRKNYAKSLVGQ